MAKDQYPLGDYLKSINETKEDLTLRDPEWMKKYPPFIINRCLSSHMDAILMANEMNSVSYTHLTLPTTPYV